MCDRKAEIRNAHVAEETQQDSAECAPQALGKYNVEKDTAAHIREFDKKYNPTWHRVVGRSSGSYVTRETKHLIYFYLPSGHSPVQIWLKAWTVAQPVIHPKTRTAA